MADLLRGARELSASVASRLTTGGSSWTIEPCLAFGLTCAAFQKWADALAADGRVLFSVRETPATEGDCAMLGGTMSGAVGRSIPRCLLTSATRSATSRATGALSCIRATAASSSEPTPRAPMAVRNGRTDACDVGRPALD